MVFVGVAALVTCVMPGSAQDAPGAAALTRASAGRTVRLGPASGSGPAADVPLELYVARVLAGEGEPGAAGAAQEALAIAIRTFALANTGRHAAGGFDVCDGTHCQVPRPPTPASTRAALATAGRILVYDGAPAQVFYSASCGGRTERASDVWPGADFPYLRAAADDVHAGERPWAVDVPMRDAEAALRRIGLRGQRLRDVRIDGRSPSGRATRLRLSGLEPEVITGERFRAAVGATRIRSTAFSIDRRGTTLRFTGRGFGHGVGLCVLGAGLRARRGDTVEAILGQYFPGLTIGRLDGAPVLTAVEPPAEPTAPLATPAPAAPRVGVPAVSAVVPAPSPLTASRLEALAARAQEDLASRLGVPPQAFSIRLHRSIDSFRTVTGRAWWVGASVQGTAIDLAPTVALDGPESLDAIIRSAVAELLVSPALAGGPAWARVGASRYFAHASLGAVPPVPGRVECPDDDELLRSLSAPARGNAEVRAEACFARELERRGNWRDVR